MATVERFEDLEAWRLARTLAGDIYRMSRHGAFARDFGFRDQSRRAAVSIVSNIAEGFERSSTNQFLAFLDIARGSCGEVRTQLHLALDLGYIDQDQFDASFNTVIRVGKMISSLMQYLRALPRPRTPSAP